MSCPMKQLTLGDVSSPCHTNVVGNGATSDHTLPPPTSKLQAASSLPQRFRTNVVSLHVQVNLLGMGTWILHPFPNTSRPTYLCTSKTSMAGCLGSHRVLKQAVLQLVDRFGHDIGDCLELWLCQSTNASATRRVFKMPCSKVMAFARQVIASPCRPLSKFSHGDLVTSWLRENVTGRQMSGVRSLHFHGNWLASARERAGSGLSAGSNRPTRGELQPVTTITNYKQ